MSFHVGLGLTEISLVCRVNDWSVAILQFGCRISRQVGLYNYKLATVKPTEF